LKTLTTFNNKNMETLINAIENKLVAFHVGRGGRFYNEGHITYLGEDKTISDYTSDLFIVYENQDELYSLIKGRYNLEKKFDECNDSDNFTWFEDRLKFDLGEKVYISGGSRSPVGLSLAESETGSGIIDIDGGYNTTYVQTLSECSELELDLILCYSGYVSQDVLDYCREALGIEEEEEEY
jgi:hypothetical protein